MWVGLLAETLETWSHSDVGLGLSLCAVPLLQFRPQRSEEVGLERLSRRGSDSWPKLRKLGVRSDVGLGLSLCAVPLLQFRSQRSEEVGSERQSKVVAQTVIKTVNNEEGTNSRRRR